MREKLPGRRPAVTKTYDVKLDAGNKQRLHITVGFDENGRPREVFCASFKAGSSMNLIVMEACILASRLLQYGDDPKDILKSLVDDALLGTIISAVVKVDE